MSAAFDVYLELRYRIRQKIDVRMYSSDAAAYEDICPACIRNLPEEPTLEPAMLVAIDGNESLKRLQRQKEIEDASGELKTISAERPDTRFRSCLTGVDAGEVDLMKDEVGTAKASPHSL